MKVKQLEYDDFKAQTHNFNIQLVCDGIRSPENTGMIFRMAEAFNIKEITFSDGTPTSDHWKIRKTARNTQHMVDHSYEKDIEEKLKGLKKDGFLLIGLEITNTSRPIYSIDYNQTKKIVLVIGSEREGISDHILGLMDVCVHIPMFGTNSSMNVVNALSIALYEITRDS